MNIVKGEWRSNYGDGERNVLYLDIDAIAAVSVVYRGATLIKCVITLQSGETITSLGYELCGLVISELERRVRE